MANKALANPTIVINNSAVPIVPNSVSYNEGLGEQTVRAQSSGGASVQSVLSQNVETNLSKFRCSLYNTPENIELARTFKTNGNANAISATGDNFSRTFNNMALTNDYDVNLGSDTTIDLEFMGDASV